MITNFKLFEDKSFTKRDRELSFATQYLEDNQPVSKENGFVECEYSIDDDFGVLIEFTFRYWTEEEDYEKIYNYLLKNKLNICRESSYNVDSKGAFYTIAVVLSEYKIKKYANLQELKMRADKYNI